MNINEERERLTAAIRKVLELDGYIISVRRKEIGPKPPVNHKGKICMAKDCTRETYNPVTNVAGARGLCQNCYSKTFNKVKRGKLTWESLEEQGLALPKMTQQQKNENQSHPQRNWREKPIEVKVDSIDSIVT